eukprot:1306467-Prymnesium_polylepis.1
MIGWCATDRWQSEGGQRHVEAEGAQEFPDGMFAPGPLVKLPPSTSKNSRAFIPQYMPLSVSASMQSLDSRPVHCKPPTSVPTRYQVGVVSKSLVGSASTPQLRRGGSRPSSRPGSRGAGSPTCASPAASRPNTVHSAYRNDESRQPPRGGTPLARDAASVAAALSGGGGGTTRKVTSAGGSPRHHMPQTPTLQRLAVLPGDYASVNEYESHIAAAAE